MAAVGQGALGSGRFYLGQGALVAWCQVHCWWLVSGGLANDLESYFAIILQSACWLMESDMVQIKIKTIVE